MMINDFPKLKSPFVRKKINGEYVVTPEINEGYEWVFRDEEVTAVEKINGCFGYQTSVVTSEGCIPIGKIVNQKIDIKVLSYDFQNNTIEFNKILEYHKQDNNKKMIHIHVSLPYRGGNERSLLCTTDHKIYTDEGFKEASKLKKGDVVYSPSKHFSETLKQITYGSVLGDGNIELTNHSLPTLKFTHGEKQYKYLNFKARLFNNLVSNIRELGKGGFKNSGERKEVRIKTNPELVKILQNKCIRNNKKRITRELCDDISPLSLAIWYLDDGSINKGSGNQRPRASFATNSFDNIECERLSNMLKNRFGIKNRVVDYGKGNMIELYTDASFKFWNMIWMFIPDCMKYKLPKLYKNTNCCLNGEIPDNSSGLTKGVIKKIRAPKKYENTTSMYDLTVENHSNYFAGGVLVHNSNVSCVIKEGVITEVYNRKNRIQLISGDKWEQYIIKGLMNSMSKDYIDLLGDGQHFGELVGPKVQGNPYELEERYWIPFRTYARNNLSYHSWGEYPKTFESISDWFKEDLFSIFYAKRHGLSYSSESVISAEGVVFTHRDGRMAKLRRDMFSWFEGRRHKR